MITTYYHLSIYIKINLHSYLDKLEWKELTADNPTMTFYDYVYRGEQTLPISVSKADTEYWLASRGSYAGEYLWFTGLLVLSSGKDIGMSITDSNGVAVANTGERSSSSSVFEV